MNSAIHTVQQLGAQRLLALSRATKRRLLLAFDILVATSTWTAVVPRLDAKTIVEGFVFVAFVLAMGARLGLYRAVLRFAGVRVLSVIGLSYGLASLGAACWHFVAGSLLPASSYLNFALFGGALAAGIRIWVREALFQSASRQKDAVVIYGAGDAGRQVLTAITQSQTMRALALVDDDPALEGAEFHGVRVCPPTALPTLCKQHQVQTVILALPNLSRSRRAQVLQALEQLPVQIRSMPRITDILAGRREVLDLEVVSIEELLGRDPVAPLIGLMQHAISERVVCVTGAGGSIGSELARQLLKLLPKKLVLVEISEFALYEVLASIEAQAKLSDVELVPVLQSVTDTEAMTALLKHHKVQLLFHAAAYKHVPLVELNPFNGLLNNVFGTKATFDAAIAAKLEAVVLISTDKAVRPTNIMGSSKRIAELIAQAYAARKARSAAQGPVISMVRFGNVLSSSGSVIPRFQAQIRQGGPLTVTHPEITRYFMTIPEAVELVIQTAGMSKGGDVFLLDMGEPVKILDLAIRMIRLSGLKPVLPDASPMSRVRDRPGAVVSPNPEALAKSAKVQHASKLHSVPIVFTGLRPGEKLYEELLIDADAEKTEHPMIRRASERFMPLERLAPMLDALQTACEQRDRAALDELLARFEIGYHQQLVSESTSEMPYDVGDAAAVLPNAVLPGAASPGAVLPGAASPGAPSPVAATSTSLQSIELPQEADAADRAAPQQASPQAQPTIHPLLSKSLHLFFLLTRPLTLGARGIVFNDHQEVLLVRHRYEQGWQLPGGGVEIGESPVDALRREVLEEAGIEILGEPQLLGSFHNREVSDRDHVLVYRCDQFRQGQTDPQSGEIAASGFFPIDALPKGTTQGTKRRLAECFDGLALQPHW